MYLYAFLERRFGEAYEPLSEAWLSRIERGRQVEVQLWQIQMLMDGIGCTRAERLTILKRAERSLIHTTPGIDEHVADVIGFFSMMLSAHPSAPRYIKSLLKNRRAPQLNDRELLEIFSEVIKLLLDELSEERELGC
jgi:hypothetical protein